MFMAMIKPATTTATTVVCHLLTNAGDMRDTELVTCTNGTTAKGSVYPKITYLVPK